LEAITAALQRDDLAAAKAAIDPALAAYPDDPVVHNLAGVLDARRGEPRLAQDHFEAAIRLQPRSPAAYVNLARLLQERPDADPAAPEAALAVYARLLAIEPQQPEALFQTSALQARAGRFDAARQAIDRLPEAARARPPVLALRAVVLAGGGDAGGARTAVDALAAHPQLVREDIEAVLPALAKVSAPGTEHALLELLDRRGWATSATLRRLAAIESAGGRYARPGRGSRRRRRRASPTCRC
jgi:Flp pilus assembly protein TadD